MFDGYGDFTPLAGFDVRFLLRHGDRLVFGRFAFAFHVVPPREDDRQGVRRGGRAEVGRARFVAGEDARSLAERDGGFQVVGAVVEEQLLEVGRKLDGRLDVRERTHEVAHRRRGLLDDGELGRPGVFGRLPCYGLDGIGRGGSEGVTVGLQLHRSVHGLDVSVGALPDGRLRGVARDRELEVRIGVHGRAGGRRLRCVRPADERFDIGRDAEVHSRKNEVAGLFAAGGRFGENDLVLAAACGEEERRESQQCGFVRIFHIRSLLFS